MDMSKKLRFIRLTFLITTYSLTVCSTLTSGTFRQDRVRRFDGSRSKLKITLYNQTAVERTVAVGKNVDLICRVKSKKIVNIIWIKDNQKISKSERIEILRYKLRIRDAIPSDTGSYKCNVMVRNGSHIKTVFLKIIEEGIQDCGSPEEQLFSGCENPVSFPKCNAFAPPVSVEDINIKQKLQTSASADHPSLTLEVEWKVPKQGNSDIWGWQITIIDLHLSPGTSSCIQVNKKFLLESDGGDRYVNYTFDNINFGTRLMVSIQSLPAMDMRLVKKTVKTKGFCHFFPASPCCHQVKHISVEERDPSSVKVTWPGLGNSSNANILTGYDVYYASHPNDSCKKGSFRFDIKGSLNASYVIIKNLKSSCRNYTIKIRPVFTRSWCDNCSICDDYSKTGLLSKLFNFHLINNKPRVLRDVRRHSMNNVLKAFLVVVCVLFFVLLVFTVIRHRKIARGKSMETEKTHNEKTVTEVFIAHSSHCRECEDVALSVATYLNLTGHCKCFLDLCSLPKEWSPGRTQYYENEIEKRQKVIILCTMNEDQENQEKPGVRNFIYQKNLVRSEILVNSATTKFIPVYMDFASDQDVPCFLRNKKSFSLPSQLMELLLYIIEQPSCKAVSSFPVVSLQEDGNLSKQKKILEAKIRDLKIKHHKNFKNKNNNLIAKFV